MVADLLPFALGILLSPFPILPLVVLLGGARPVSVAGAYLVGWSITLLAAVVVFELLGELLDRPDTPSTWLLVVRAAIGVLLIVLGARQWIAARQGTPDPPSWLAALSDMGAPGAARFGATMAGANPKILVFAAGAGVTIGSADLPLGGVVGWSLVMVVLASAVLLVLYAARVVFGRRADAPLQALNDWLLRHGKTLTAAVLVVLGAVVLLRAVLG